MNRCPCCMEEHEVRIINVVQHNEFKGVSVGYEAEYHYCDRADETLRMRPRSLQMISL